MICWFKLILGTAVAGFRNRRNLVLENLALRQQLMVLAKSGRKPRFTEPDRLFWVAYSRFVDGWRHILHIARPRTVVDWQKRRFRRFWSKKSRGSRPGRPRIDPEIRDLIQSMSRANPSWGTPRIVGELAKLKECKTAYRSPWQNPYCERIIGSIRRECLDHLIIIDESHLRRILKSYLGYYHLCRTHLSLEMDCPEPRATTPPENGKIVALPKVGGLHHFYTRKAA